MSITTNLNAEQVRAFNQQSKSFGIAPDKLAGWALLNLMNQGDDHWFALAETNLDRFRDREWKEFKAGVTP